MTVQPPDSWRNISGHMYVACSVGGCGCVRVWAAADSTVWRPGGDPRPLLYNREYNIYISQERCLKGVILSLGLLSKFGRLDLRHSKPSRSETKDPKGVVVLRSPWKPH